MNSGSRPHGAARGVPTPATGHGSEVFLFFSNRLGCLGSLLISVIATLILLAILGVL